VKRRAALLACIAVLAACNDDERFLESAEFGIFYGGQVQEREQIPFVVDESRQQQGFRLVLARPAKEPMRIRWELSRPGMVPRGKALPSPEDRVTELGEATLPAGQLRFEKRFPFAAGDPLGLWNIRVTAGQHLAIDRPFTVYDAAARKRARRAGRRVDAGR
jgi:hypothetical protein